jgi:cytochrome P450
MNYENLKKMKFIDCIQEEVSRIYGPGTGVFLREATKDTQLLNIPIKKGTSLSIKPMQNHCNPLYFEEPLIFKP